jgi:hypothetical protein
MSRARPDERTGRSVGHTDDVADPSGLRFQLRGVFGAALHAPTGVWPTIRVGTEGRRLDPRAVVTCDGPVIYAPRRERLHDRERAAWLAKHPERPRIALDTAADDR